MLEYESIIILNVNCSEKKKTEIIEKVKEFINSDGEMKSVEELGKKKLAYEIKNNSEGYYILFNFLVNPMLIPKLEKMYRITDEIIKFITVMKTEE